MWKELDTARERGDEEYFCCPERSCPGLGYEKVLLMKSATVERRYNSK